MRITLLVSRNQRRRLLEKSRNLLAELIEVGATGEQHLRSRRILRQGIEQVLNRHEFVTFVVSPVKGLVQRQLEFCVQHTGFPVLPASRGILSAAAGQAF